MELFILEKTPKVIKGHNPALQNPLLNHVQKCHFIL